MKILALLINLFIGMMAAFWIVKQNNLFKRKEKTMTKFNLNDNILVQITDYGWEELAKYEEKSGNKGFTEHCIKSRKEVINGEDWYKLQAHFVISTFGDMVWASHPAPLKPTILIPKD